LRLLRPIRVFGFGSRIVRFSCARHNEFDDARIRSGIERAWGYIDRHRICGIAVCGDDARFLAREG